MTKEETQLIEMLRRVLKGMMLGEEYMPGQFELADFLEKTRDAIEKRDQDHIQQAVRFCEEMARRSRMEESRANLLRIDAYEGISDTYEELCRDLDGISNRLKKGECGNG